MSGVAGVAGGAGVAWEHFGVSGPVGMETEEGGHKTEDGGDCGIPFPQRRRRRSEDGKRTKLIVKVSKSGEIDTSENWSAGAMQGKKTKGERRRRKQIYNQS